MLLTPHRRRARRRLISALATVLLATLGSVTALSVPPASAQSAPAPFQTKVNRAVTDAGIALQKAGCNGLLSPPLSEGFRAIDLLNLAPTHYEPTAAPPLDPSTTVASVREVGLSKPIFIHDPFDQIGQTLQIEFGGRPEIVPTFDQQRAIVILHEVGHLTGVEGQHEGGRAEDGTRFSKKTEERLYNTRILNFCFAPRYLVTGLSCFQTFTYNGIFDVRSELNCFGSCRIDAGPLTVSWSSNLQPHVEARTDVRTFQDGESCTSSRVSECPVYGLNGPAEVTMNVTDLTGHISSDTVRVDCINFQAPVW